MEDGAAMVEVPSLVKIPLRWIDLPLMQLDGWLNLLWLMDFVIDVW